MIPKNFTYLDSFVVPRKLQQSGRALTEYISEDIRFKYFLELKERRDSISRATYKVEDFPFQRLIYILVWLAPNGIEYLFKVGQSQHCHQRIGSNYLVGSGANTGWLSPAMWSFLKEKGGEFKIYARGFDKSIVQQLDDIEVEYTPRLDKIEKLYQEKLGIKDGKKAVNEFFAQHNFSYIIK